MHQLLIDIEALKGSKAIMKQKFSRIVEYYYEDTASYIDTIQEGIVQQDVSMVIPAAHTIKSSSRQLGATRLADVAYDLETKAKQVMQGELPFEQLVPIARTMPELFERTRAQMETAIEEVIAVMP